MKKIAKILILLVSVFLISSCSDDKVTTPKVEEELKMPLSIGNWWKYEVYEVDDNGEIVGSLLNTFTITVDRRDSVEGKYAYILREDGRKKGGYSMTMDATKDGIYFYEPWIWGEIGVDEEPPYIDPWPMVIDFKNASWEMYNVAQDYKGYNSEGTSKWTKSGKNMGAKSVVYENIEYSTLEIMNIYEKKYDAKYFYPNDTTIKELRVDTTEFQFIPGIGIYSYTRMDKTPNERHFRRKEILVDHGIK